MKILPNNIAVLERDLISGWVEQTGRLDHDQNTLPIVLPHIKPGDWVIDGGAFIGDHTIAYEKAVGQNGMVLAFEPNPLALDCLRHNCNGKRVCVFPYGLGENFDAKEFVVTPNNCGASFCERKISKEGNERNAVISIVTIDSRTLSRCDFIKLDIEGCEYKALKGAEDTVARCRPKMLLEINRGALARQGDSPESIYEWLLERCYDFKPIWPTSKLEDEQLDILCLPR